MIVYIGAGYLAGPAKRNLEVLKVRGIEPATLCLRSAPTTTAPLSGLLRCRQGSEGRAGVPGTGLDAEGVREALPVGRARGLVRALAQGCRQCVSSLSLE